ncbi:MAG: GTPase Era [Patescibacteria group bacterium]
MTSQNVKYKSGIIVLVGRSNVGKSTLLNALVGKKIAPVSPLPQTTRQPVQGVLTTKEGQLVFVDTPGLFKGLKDHLTGRINQTIKDSMEGVDLVLYVVDPTRMVGEEELALLGMVRPLPIPKLLVMNKNDVGDAPYREDYKDLREDFAATVEVSTLTGSGLNTLVRECFHHVPEGFMWYPPEEKTNIARAQWVAEMIREKLYYYLHKELPYTATVRVEEIKERDNTMLYIRAVVVTTDARYRKMIIGHGAQKIKEIGTAARKELSLALNQPIFLDLTVEVDPHWMEREG